MINLARYENDGWELQINTETGASFANTSAIARMCSTSDKVITQKQIASYANTLLKRGKINAPLEAEINTPGGLQRGKIYDEKAIVKFIAKYNPDLLDKFAEAGVRVFLHQLAGFEVKSTAVSQANDLSQALFNELSSQVKRVSYNDTQANSTIATIKPYERELGTKNESTKQVGLMRANIRLMQENVRSMQMNHCQNTVHKQQRHAQIAMEGVESVPDKLLTAKERADKAKALKNNPSSKERLLPELKQGIVPVN